MGTCKLLPGMMFVKIENYTSVDAENEDCSLPLSFTERRHTEKIEGLDLPIEYQSWRMKERMKTVSVALVVCLNVGVDPPDIIKTQPCARLECWIDPLSLRASKALEAVGSNLQKQYERWQPRARYKQSLDPTVDDIKKLCTSLRRSAKEERVLFHYNGHGVPKPTANGEIWVFNKTYTQYIPLSVYDLQAWLGSPSIYVYDCSNAGIIIDLFKHFADQHEKEFGQALVPVLQHQVSNPTIPTFKNCIQLAACQADQILPMNPDLPADIFTSCLTTPIKVALKWFMMQNSSKLVPDLTTDLIDKIPGQLNDRRTMLGELNWIFTAVTDTIAWNVLPRDMFQKLFRQDLLVASLFRNYLLAERVMRSYNCSPLSCPKLPPTYQHPMWQAWDLALDRCLSQLPGILESDEPYIHSLFFEEHLTAFEVWLSVGLRKKSLPEQLPIVLQVLLSHAHRLRALELLSRFLDLGPWAVYLALCVGIFPYILKLLQSCAHELRGILVFIWTKIVAVDKSVQADLVRENGHKYFLQVLQDPTAENEHKTMAAFIMSVIVHRYPPGQEIALQCNLVSVCLDLLNDPNTLLRQWLIICLGSLWRRYDNAKWCGVRDIAHEKLYSYLKDDSPEIRAATVFALGTFMNIEAGRSEHANNIDQSVCTMLMNVVSQDMSPFVRKELVVALQWLVIAFENVMLNIATLEYKEWKEISTSSDQTGQTLLGSIKRNLSRDRIKLAQPVLPLPQTVAIGIDCVSSPENILLEPERNGIDRIKRVSSSNSINSLGYSSNNSSSSTLSPVSYGTFHTKLWQGLSLLDSDPFLGISIMSHTVTDYIRDQISQSVLGKELLDRPRSSFHSLPPSPSNRSPFLNDSPPQDASSGSSTDFLKSGHRSRAISSQGSKGVPDKISEGEAQTTNNKSKQLVSTEFCEWCTKYFCEPTLSDNKHSDTESNTYYERQWRYSRNKRIRQEALEEHTRASQLRLENQIFSTRSSYPTSTLLFHPYEPHIFAAAKESFIIWDYQSGTRLCHSGLEKNNLLRCAWRITAMDLINSHDISMLLVGHEDGSIKLWSNYSSMVPGQEPNLVTAWQGLPELSSSKTSAQNGVSTNTGVRMSWDQSSQHLLVGGDVRVIKIWDAESEMKLQDIATGTDSCVNSISVDHNEGQIFAIGCGDGSVRVFDKRLPSVSARTMTYREHTGCIASVKIRRTTPEMLMAGCVYGEVRIFDLRNKSSVLACRTTNNIAALAFHSAADIFACGTVNQVISLYNTDGNILNTGKSHDWFMTPRLSTPVSSMAFHPHRVLFAYGLMDSSISVCGLEAKRWYLSSIPG